MCNYGQQCRLSLSVIDGKPYLLHSLVLDSGRDLSKHSPSSAPSPHVLDFYALCVRADRKYQVIFCNFSALSIDLWLLVVHGCYPPLSLLSVLLLSHASALACALFAKQKGKSQVNVVYLKYCACGCQVRPLCRLPLQGSSCSCPATP